MPTKNEIEQVMAAPKGMVSGLQCAPGRFRYSSEFITSNLRRAFGIFARMIF